MHIYNLKPLKNEIVALLRLPFSDCLEECARQYQARSGQASIFHSIRNILLYLIKIILDCTDSWPPELNS